MANHPQEDMNATHSPAAAPPLPNIRSPLVELAPGEVPEQYAEDLARGRAVVCETFTSAVAETRRATVIPDRTMSRAISAHGVGFGWLEAPHVSRQVAYKPFSRPANALAEIHGYQVLQQLGIETYTPLGAFPSADRDQWVVLTEFRQDLVSLDRDQWVVGRAATSFSLVEVAERNGSTVRDIATMMAYIHSHGVYHPDGQIKNWAKTPDGRIGIIDTEHLMQVAIGDLNAVGLAWQDIEKLSRSLIATRSEGQDGPIYGVGMLHGMSLELTRSSIYELIIQPYLESLVAQLADCSSERAVVIQALYDGLSAKFENAPEWPGHFIAGNRH